MASPALHKDCDRGYKNDWYITTGKFSDKTNQKWKLAYLYKKRRKKPV